MVEALGKYYPSEDDACAKHGSLCWPLAVNDLCDIQLELRCIKTCLREL